VRHYIIRELTFDDLRKIFPDGVANQRNFCLFSTSGVHGSYRTIEEAESDPDVGTVTVLVVHPRLASVQYGNVPVNAETAPFLKSLRASSWAMVQRIGAP
jgi:hypothetical protein